MYVVYVTAINIGTKIYDWDSVQGSRAGAAAAALLGLARFGSKLLKSCNFIPRLYQIRSQTEGVKLKSGGMLHTPQPGVLRALQQCLHRSRLAARSTFLWDCSYSTFVASGLGVCAIVMM